MMPRVKRGRGQRRNRRTHCSRAQPCVSCRKRDWQALLWPGKRFGTISELAR